LFYCFLFVYLFFVVFNKLTVEMRVTAIHFFGLVIYLYVFILFIIADTVVTHKTWDGVRDSCVERQNFAKRRAREQSWTPLTGSDRTGAH